jgi:hypothetical protein
MILRLKQVRNRLACGKTKFEEDYRWHTAADPDVPGMPGVKRLKPIPLGERNIGFLEHELDALIDALAAARDVTPPTPRPAQSKEARPGRGRASQTGASRRGYGVASGGTP